jgi:uncharacterized protein YjbI with pentapeptide repeats
MAKLDGADMRNCNALRMDAEFASMQEALLDNANFRGSSLIGADLSNASVAGLDLTDSDVSGARLLSLTAKDKIVGLDSVRNRAEAEFE